MTTKNVAIKNRQAAVLDIEGEYKGITEMLNGRTIKIKQGTTCGINIFDIDEDEGQLNLLDKVAEIRAILNGIMNNYMGKSLNAKELMDIESAVIDVFKEKGITKDAESLYKKEGGAIAGKFTLEKIKKELPTLSDFQRVLETKKNGKNIAEILKGFLAGKSLGFFDCQSTVSIKDQFIQFDLSEITDDVTKYYTSIVITAWIAEKYMTHLAGHEKIVTIDEVWYLLKHPETSQFIENLARRARKKRCSIIPTVHSI